MSGRRAEVCISIWPRPRAKIPTLVDMKFTICRVFTGNYKFIFSYRCVGVEEKIFEKWLSFDHFSAVPSKLKPNLKELAICSF